MTRYVYLGGPITGLSFDTAKDWREQLVARSDWPTGWVPLSPMRDKEQFRMEGPLPSTFDGEREPFEQDLSDIRQADALVFNFLGASWASIGSCAEMGYAYALGKPILAVVEKGTIHDHLFVNNMAEAVTNMSFALAWLRDLYSVEAFADELASAA